MPPKATVPTAASECSTRFTSAPSTPSLSILPKDIQNPLRDTASSDNATIPLRRSKSQTIPNPEVDLLRQQIAA